MGSPRAMQGLRVGSGAVPALFQYRQVLGNGAQVGCKNVMLSALKWDFPSQSSRSAFPPDGALHVCRDKVNRVLSAATANSTLQQSAVEEKVEVTPPLHPCTSQSNEVIKVM